MMRAIAAASSSLRAAAFSGHLQSSRDLSHLGTPLHVRLKLSRIEATPTLKFSSTSSALNPAYPGNQPRKVFVDYAVYKGKSAMKLRPSKPLFKLLENGAAALVREGSLIMDMAPAIGPRQYDWNQKQIFALSVLELGTLLDMPEEGCEFYHDPNMGKSDAGMIRKIFKIEPMKDKSGYFLNLSVSNKLEQMEGRISIPVSKGEFAVMRSTINFIIPHLMGWHVFVDPLKLDSSMLSNDSSSSNAHLWKDDTSSSHAHGWKDDSSSGNAHFWKGDSPLWKDDAIPEWAK